MGFVLNWGPGAILLRPELLPEIRSLLYRGALEMASYLAADFAKNALVYAGYSAISNQFTTISNNMGYDQVFLVESLQTPEEGIP